MAAAKKPLKATTSFVCTGDDVNDHFIREGEVVAADHPAVEGREELFVEHDPNKPTAA
jgi:hypothetical protein